MKIYMVACYKPNRVAGRSGFAQASRMHVHGVYLEKENARLKCAELNFQLEKSAYTERMQNGQLRYKNHVIYYKVHDAGGAV